MTIIILRVPRVSLLRYHLRTSVRSRPEKKAPVFVPCAFVHQILVRIKFSRVTISADERVCQILSSWSPAAEY